MLGSRLLGWRTVCYVEKNKYCVEIIKNRIRDGILDDAPIWDDVQTFNGIEWRDRVHVISAGFPCQPYSAAGCKRAGDDPRNGWPATLRVIGEVKPKFIFLENVPGLRYKPHGYLGQVLSDLAACGYDARWDCIPASILGAPHIRDRLWIIAYARRDLAYRIYRTPKAGGNLGIDKPSHKPIDWNGFQYYRQDSFYRQGPLPPRLHRVDDGLADWLDRLRALGNGQVPQVVKLVWELFTRFTV